MGEIKELKIGKIKLRTLGVEVPDLLVVAQ